MQQEVQLDARYLRACAVVLQPEALPRGLRGVRIEVREHSVRYVGCDGHRLVVFHVAADGPLAPAALTIPAEIATSIKLPRRAGHMWLRYDAENPISECTLVGTLGGDRTFTPLADQYPDYERVIPRSRPLGRPAQFDWQYLADLQKVCEIATGKVVFPVVHCDGDDMQSPATVLCRDLPEFFGLVMPRRHGRDELAWALPDWLAPAREEERKAA